MTKKFLLFILFLLVVNSLTAQIVTNLPVIKTPDRNTPTNPLQNFPRVNQPNNPHDPTIKNTQQRNNQAILEEVRQFENKRISEEQIKHDRIQATIEKGFGSQSDEAGTEHYYNAYNEINNMLEGNSPLSLKRALFVTENAYYGNQYIYDEFSDALKEDVRLIGLKIDEEKLERNDNITKNMMIFRYIVDTLRIKDKKNIYTHLPITYNYDDYESKKSFDSHFVIKLMQSGKGQCYSMPLYYLLLAEEIGADAYWSYSPKHTFVKIQDEDGVWYNLELTCKGILSDAHYMNNSYIKAEAIRNRIYLEPMDMKNSIAAMLIELAGSYYTKYGLDDFYLQCAETALEYMDNKSSGLLLKAAYQTKLTLFLAHLLEAKNPEEMKKKSPEAYKHHELMLELYRQVDDTGYEDLPDDLYAKWLEYTESERKKADKQRSIFINIPYER